MNSKQNPGSRGIGLLFGAASVLALSAPAAFAQQAPAAQPAAASSQADDAIIVTANKRDQNLQDTPVAVTAVSAAKLESVNLMNISQLTEIAPSLSFVPAPSPATTMFVIRGVGTFAFNDALEQSVGLVVDGVPMARLVGSISDAVDLNQIQVLRGPQGTIFGKNATAGLISIDYRDPTFTQSFDARGFIGTYNERRFQGTVNTPIGDKVAIRLSAWDQTRDGYINAPNQPTGKIGGVKDYGGRAKVLFQPVTQWTVDLTAEFRNDHTDGSIQTTRGYIVNQNTGLINSGLDNAARLNDIAHGVVAGPNNNLSLKDYPEGYQIHQARQVAKSVYDFGPVSLTGIGGHVFTYTDYWQDSDYTSSLNNPLYGQGGVVHYHSTVEQYTGELRLANRSTDALKYTLGLFYYNVHVLSNQDSQSPIAPPANPATYPAYATLADVRTTNYAAFADVSYDWQKFTVYGGGRASDEHTTGSLNRFAPPAGEFQSGVLQPFSVNSTNGPLSVTSPGITYKDFSWRAGAQYHFDSDIMVYGQASRAYKGPGLNFGPSLTQAQFNLNQAAVAPEIAFNYEGGIRSQWLNRQLTLNLTGFYERFTNFQVTAVLPTQPTSFTTVNAPLLIAQGVELEYAWRPRDWIPGLSFDGNAVWNDTHYGDFKNAPCFTGQIISAVVTTAQGVCSASGTGGATVENVSGLRAVGAPEWQFGITARYEHELAEKYKWFGSVHSMYNSDIQYGVNENPLSIQKAYDTVDLSTGISPLNGHWTLTFYLKNATNTRFASRISLANPTINQTFTFDAVRSGGVALDLSF